LLLSGDRRWPAWLDLAQGLSGLALVLFMWGHMLAVSSILLGKDAMYAVARFFEGSLLFATPQPWLVSVVVLLVFSLFVLHGLLALRKVPEGYRQWRAWWVHMRGMHHADTSLWLLQVVTGVILMFFATAHLYQMLLHPADIGPLASAGRVWTGRWWPFYLLLLFAVELHGGVGLYRLALKWGWFSDSDGRLPRQRLVRIKWALTAFFIALGLITLLAYMKVGYDNRDRVGERYVPTHLQSGAH
jgi:fumarate reductase subunit C